MLMICRDAGLCMEAWQRNPIQITRSRHGAVFVLRHPVGKRIRGNYAEDGLGYKPIITAGRRP